MPMPCCVRRELLPRVALARRRLSKARLNRVSGRPDLPGILSASLRFEPCAACHEDHAALRHAGVGERLRVVAHPAAVAPQPVVPRYVVRTANPRRIRVRCTLPWSTSRPKPPVRTARRRRVRAARRYSAEAPGRACQHSPQPGRGRHGRVACDKVRRA